MTSMNYIHFILISEASLNVVLLGSTKYNSNDFCNTFYFTLQPLRN